MILNGDPDVVKVHTDKIKRKRKGRAEGGCASVSLITEPEVKVYSISYLKRRRLNDNISVPFGYIKGFVKHAVV
jgi:hypothetical protein